MTTDKKKIEKILQTSAQGRNPFCVPDGYFSSVYSRVMEKIKQEENTFKQAGTTVIQAETTSMTFVPANSGNNRPLWIRLAIAAVFTGLFSVAGTMLYRQHLNSTALPSDNITSMSDITEIDYNDDLLDYAMLSNSDIACYLTSAE